MIDYDSVKFYLSDFNLDFLYAIDNVDLLWSSFRDLMLSCFSLYRVFRDCPR